VQSRPFTVSRKVDCGELAEESTRSFVVRVGGLLFGLKRTESNLFPIDSDFSGPEIPGDGHPLESRRSGSRFRIRPVLRIARNAKIVPAVIQPVSVSVIDDSIRLSHQVSMQKYGSRHTGIDALLGRSAACRVFSFAGHKQRPVPLRCILKVRLINSRKFPLRKRNESNPSLGRRLRFGSGYSSSVTVALRAAFVAKLSPKMRRKSDGKIRTAFDASQLIQSHCSPPFTSASRAPVGNTTRGYFNGGYYGAT